MANQVWTPADLRAWRSHQSWTQAKAAEELGISRESFVNLENGKHPIDRRTMLACMALTAHLPGLPFGYAEDLPARKELGKAAAAQLFSGAHNMMLVHGHTPILIRMTMRDAFENFIAGE